MGKQKYILFLSFLVLLGIFIQFQIPSNVNYTNSKEIDTIKTYNYWCTWSSQAKAKKISGKPTADNLDENYLFGPNNWLDKIDQDIRKDLIIVIDDGWDIPYSINKQKPARGAMELFSERFPSFTGNPSEKLAKLNNKIRSMGFRGLGLWVAAQAHGEKNPSNLIPLEEQKEYWQERARWSNYAGILYWKIDWGARWNDIEFRKMVSDIVKPIAPNLIIEHAVIFPMINGANVKKTDTLEKETFRFENKKNYQNINKAFVLLSFCEVLRTYDVVGELSIPATLDRIATYLTEANKNQNIKAHLNIEDQVYIGAALGFNIGVMRLNNTESSMFDEVKRTLKWQRIAPPFPLSSGNLISTNILYDECYFYPENKYWLKNGARKIKQGSPSILCRNIHMPKVNKSKINPYVIASKHPNGATSIAFLPRIKDCKHFTPKINASIKWESNKPLSIFGFFNEITINTNKSLKNKRIFAQDLLCNEAIDITDKIIITNKSLKIKSIVLPYKQSPNDNSAPGVMIFIKE